jgi:1,4-dihydroxy-6-naphthoate synthase
MLPTSQKVLSVGISPCPNDVFIFGALMLGKIPTGGLAFRFDLQDVETLNQAAQQAAFDVVKISCAAYPFCQQTYEMLPAGGALGRGVGPLLLSTDGVWSPERETLVPGPLTTANLLLDFYAKRPLPKAYLPFDALYSALCRGEATQGVVIHEKRFTYAHDGLHLIQDLGTYWEEQTGTPIPLGVIVARRDLQLQGVLTDLLRASLRYAYAHYEEIFALCKQHAHDLQEEVIAAHIRLYVNDYSYDPGEEGRRAMEYLLRYRQERVAAL